VLDFLPRSLSVMLPVKNNFKTVGFFQLKSLGRAKNSIPGHLLNTERVVPRFSLKNPQINALRVFVMQPIIPQTGQKWSKCRLQ
jgi:hypothetical protein